MKTPVAIVLLLDGVSAMFGKPLVQRLDRKAPPAVHTVVGPFLQMPDPVWRLGGLAEIVVASLLLMPRRRAPVVSP